MSHNKVLIGIKPTGYLHIGHLYGILTQALNYKNPIFLIADYHAMTSQLSNKEIKHYSNSIISYLNALGYPSSNIYLQSEIPNILSLYWSIMCIANKGLVDRSHSYKATDNKNAINMGTYTYSLLQCADLAISNCSHVLVGLDQKQHIEYAKLLIKKINNKYSTNIAIPEAIYTDTLISYDNRKMSKSYNNTIPLNINSTKLKKIIFSIPTDSSQDDIIRNNNSFNYLKKIITKKTKKIIETQPMSWFLYKTYIYNDIYEQLTNLQKQIINNSETIPKNNDQLIADIKNNLKQCLQKTSPN